ncbi:uncharacterized protein BDV14DRAFT_203716 [Aspergillus stella-maris]|uniref:uncharacterized protein n=1 Tax=Aspergillus stella-maris TaxID=1810926 RepID=UPI003CCDBBC5
MYPSNPPTQPLPNQNTNVQSSPSELLRAYWSDSETNQLITLPQANSNLTWSEFYRLGHFPGRSLSALQCRYSTEIRARESRASQGREGGYQPNHNHSHNYNTGSGTASLSAPEYILITDSEDENDVGDSGGVAVENPNVNATPTKKNTNTLSTPVASPFSFRIQKNGWVAYRNYPRTPTSVETSAASPRIEEGPAADSNHTLSGSPLTRMTMKGDTFSPSPVPSETGTPRSSLAVHEPRESVGKSPDISAAEASHDHTEIYPTPRQLSSSGKIDAERPKTQVTHNHSDLLNLQRRVLKAQRRARRAEERYHKRARRAEELEKELNEAERQFWLAEDREDDGLMP